MAHWYCRASLCRTAGVQQKSAMFVQYLQLPFSDKTASIKQNTLACLVTGPVEWIEENKYLTQPFT